MGYTARPDGIQILFYVATIVAIGGLTRLLRPVPAPRPAPAE